jgi:hypothetical protein
LKGTRFFRHGRESLPLARSRPKDGVDDKHDYDCWDTNRNTTSLLLVLQAWGLLKYHVVGDPHYRGNALVLQPPHNTVVLVERATTSE